MGGAFSPSGRLWVFPTLILEEMAYVGSSRCPISFPPLFFAPSLKLCDSNQDGNGCYSSVLKHLDRRISAFFPSLERVIQR